MSPRVVSACTALAALALAGPAAAAEPQRTRFELPSANGWGALLLDLKQARLTHFREHVFAAEEPVIDAEGEDVWDGEQFGTVHTRDLLFDAYFGARAEGEQFWLTKAPVDEDASGYVAWTGGEQGGTGVVAMVQSVGALRATTYAFAPQGLGAAGFVLVLKLENTGGAALEGVSGFSLHNFHLGFGRPKRPWDVHDDIGENGETLEYEGGGAPRFRERGFAGVVVARALAPIAHRGVGPGADLFQIVDAGAVADLPDNAAPANAVDGAVSAFQWDFGDLAPGAEAWAGIAVIHHADPFAAAAAEAKLDAYLAGKGAEALLDAEIAGWAELQNQQVVLPRGASPAEAAMLRQGAAMLHMGQVREDRAFLREFLSQDGEPRRTRFPDLQGKAAALPTWVEHRGEGAVLASLPPGEWTYAWIRDGAYATTAMATLGLKDHAKASLLYYLEAESGRFQDWEELAPYAMPPYQISLVRYHGFGVEETDFNNFGPNLEFDGFGLFLWTLRAYEVLTGDTSVADERWEQIAGEVADVLVALIDPETGLVRADSSIWETHWKGRERRWAYTSITAARGLCDAAAIAERRGDAARADKYRAAGEALRAAIAAELTDAGGAIASSYEELQSGAGYYDAAVWDAIAMGLFDPQGPIAQATIAGLDEHLRVEAGPGWSRNDDRWDHANQEDLSGWGGEYDSAEWVITDLRGSIALRMAGETDRADALLEWVRAQTEKNYGMVAETYDELTGTYKFNAPMLGFGAGAYALALAHRAGAMADPACGAYFDEGVGETTGTSTGEDTSTSTGEGTSTGDAGTSAPTTGVTPTTGDAGTTGSLTGPPGPATAGLTSGDDDGGSGCACATGSRPDALAWLALAGLGIARRRRRRAAA